MIHRRIEIRVEREVVSQTAVCTPGWCSHCAREVMMLSTAAAAEVSGATPREIYRWLEQGKFHFRESPGGVVLVCAESLKESFGPRGRWSK